MEDLLEPPTTRRVAVTGRRGGDGAAGDGRMAALRPASWRKSSGQAARCYITQCRSRGQRSAEVVGRSRPRTRCRRPRPALDHHAARRHGSRSPTPNCAKVLRTLAWLRPHAMYTNSSNAPLLAPLDLHHPTHIRLRAHARPIVVNTITTPLPRSASATFQMRRQHTFNFNDSPSTLHPPEPPQPKQPVAAKLQHPLPEQPLLKPAAGPA